MQELCEVPLREDHAGGEVLVRQAEQLLHRGCHAGVRSEHLGPVALTAEGGRLGESLQPGILDADQAAGGAAKLARRDVAFAAHVEDQPDGAPAHGRRQRERDGAPVVPAGDRPVEGERHRVDHGRLPGPSWSDQHEVVHVTKVHCGRITEGAESGHVQQYGTHRGGPLLRRPL